jgi:predicted Zn-dependent protease
MSSSRLDTLRAIVAKSPSNAPARYGLANELVKAGEFEEAVTALKEYLAMHDDEGSAYRLLAQSYVKLGRPAEAREAYLAGSESALKHGHPGMAEEFKAAVEDLDDE